MNTKPSERVRFILGACYGVVPHFSLKVPPYNTLSSQQKPTKAMLVKEVRRRNPKIKTRKVTNANLILSLEAKEQKIILYIYNLKK